MRLAPQSTPARLHDACCSIAVLSFLLSTVGVVLSAPPAVTGLSSASLQRGGSIDITLQGKPGTLPLNAWSDRDDVDLAIDEDGQHLTVTASETTQAGLCWIRLFNSEGATDLFPLLIGVLPVIEETEPNNGTSAAQQIASLPVTVNGVLHKTGEVDTFAVPIEAGQTLIASLDAHHALASPMDAVLQVLSPAGFVIAQNDDDHGFDPRIDYLATTSGTHYVRTFAFPATPNSSIRFDGGADHLYRLTLTTGPFVDHVLPADSTEADDGPVPIGWNLSDEISLDNIPGFHHLHGRDSLSGLMINEAVAQASPDAVTLPSTIVGHISSPGEVDTFAFDAEQDRSLTFSAHSRLRGSALDPVVRVTDETGKVLKETDDVSRANLDALLSWTAPQSGTYRVTVTDRFGHAGLRYVYWLTVQHEIPRVELNVAANRYLLKRDAPLEIPVTVSRLAGHDDELAITITGAPDGVAVTSATSESTGDSAKQVTLTLEAGTAPSFQGPVEIVARTREDESPVVRAHAPTRIPSRQTGAIWLTILPPPAEAEDSSGEQ